ncbi:MAG: DUF3352 domain-containing protein, partial [Synechococcaceae cyanobacterium]
WLLALGSRDDGGARRFLQRFWQTSMLAGSYLHVSRSRGKVLISGRGALGGLQPLPLATALIDDDLVLIASGRQILEQALDVSQIAAQNQAALPELQQAPQRFGATAALLVARAPALERWLGLPSLAGDPWVEAVAAAPPPTPLQSSSPSPSSSVRVPAAPVASTSPAGVAPGGSPLPVREPNREDPQARRGDQNLPESSSRETSTRLANPEALLAPGREGPVPASPAQAVAPAPTPAPPPNAAPAPPQPLPRTAQDSAGVDSGSATPPRVSASAEPGPNSNSPAPPAPPAPEPFAPDLGSQPQSAAAQLGPQTVEPGAVEPAPPATPSAAGLAAEAPPTPAASELAAADLAEPELAKPDIAAADLEAPDLEAPDLKDLSPAGADPGPANSTASRDQPARLGLPIRGPWSPDAKPTPVAEVDAQPWRHWLGAAAPAFAAAPNSPRPAPGSAGPSALAATANLAPRALTAPATSALSRLEADASSAEQSSTAVPPSRQLVLALRPEGRDLLLQADVGLGGPLPPPLSQPAMQAQTPPRADGSDAQGGDEALQQGLLAGLRGPIHSLALLHNPAAWRQLLPLRPWFHQLFAGPGAGPLPALVAAADDELLVAAEGPLGWQLGTAAEHPPLRSLEAPLAASGLIAAPLEQGDRSLLVWTRLQLAPARSGRLGTERADQLQATLAGWWSRDGQLAWWGRSLAQLRQEPSGPQRLRQLEALARPLAPLHWALDGPTARTLLSDWQPWRLLSALAGGGLEDSISGLAVAAEPSSMGLALKARLELG